MTSDLEITRGHLVIGYVRTIDLAKPGEASIVRYIGMQGPDAGKAATGQARETMKEAEQDVHNWADGKPVAYLQQAVVPLPAHVKERLGIARLADAAAAGAKFPIQ